MTRLTELLNKDFANLTAEEKVELVALLKEKDIDVDTVNEETLETIRNIFKEEDIMNNETAATMEKKAVAEKAAEFAEKSKETLEKGFKYALENLKEVGEIAQEYTGLSVEEIEQKIIDGGHNLVEKIVHTIENQIDKNVATGISVPSFKKAMDAQNVKLGNIVNNIKEVLDRDDVKGWGKFKEIVKAIASWIGRLFLKVASIVLKLALTIVAGTIKIGATLLCTGVRTAKVLHKEVIKPTVNSSKNAWRKHKEKMAAMKEFEDEFEEDFSEVEEMLFEN